MATTQPFVATEINQVIDKLAEKLGMAANEIAPLAEKIVAEYQAKATVGAIVCAAVAVVLIGATAAWVRFGMKQYAARKCKDEDGWLPAIIIPAVGCGIAVVPLFIEGLQYLMQSIAPTFYCLKELL